jgi:hypothetical protein
MVERIAGDAVAGDYQQPFRRKILQDHWHAARRPPRANQNWAASGKREEADAA